MINFDENAKITYDKEEFKKATINLFPENPTESTVSDLNNALDKTIDILNAIDGTKD